MVTKIPISNILRIDNLNNKKAKLVYKDMDSSIKDIELKSAEKYWLKKYPHDSLILKLEYISNGIHYVADKYRSPQDLHHRTLTFFLPNDDTIQFYSDETNEIKFNQTINLLNSHKWGTFDVN